MKLTDTEVKELEIMDELLFSVLEKYVEVMARICEIPVEEAAAMALANIMSKTGSLEGLRACELLTLYQKEMEKKEK